MSNRKERREIDKAIQRLMQFQVENEPWRDLMEDYLSEMFVPLADAVNVSVDDAEDSVMGGDYGVMAFGYLFEEFATAAWDGADKNMIEEYLQQRGWREGTHGRRYLRALGGSELELWEIVATRPGIAVDIRLFGTQDKPVRVKEQAASESLHPWDCIAARVLHVDARPVFSGGILNFTPSQTQVIQRTLARAGEELKDLLLGAEQDGELDLTDNLEDYIEAEMQDQLSGVAFTVWASGILDLEEHPMPQMFNMDNEPIELIRQRFPITGQRDAIVHALNQSPVLFNNAGDSWDWYPSPVDEIADDERISIHGHISLTDQTLELETNSAPRASRGKVLVQALAGEHLGEPLTVHENLGRALEDTEFGSEPDMDLNASAEVQALLQAQLTAHYRATLDEPIPMLNGKTPRACAADPQTRHEVIEWLKFLENTDHRSPQPGYDFTWMWQELELDHSGDAR